MDIKRVVRASLEDILRDSPPETVPMFRVDSSKDEHLLDERVYHRNGKFYLCMCDEEVDEADLVTMTFLRYMKMGDF